MLDDLASRAPDDPPWWRSFATVEHALRARPGRALAAVLAVAAVAVGTWWLVRTPPPPPPEALLPFASTTVAARDTSTATASAAPGIEPATVTVVVHVAGAVVRPGVLRLPQGARVVDAVAAAGGATPDADTERINLAAALVDGAWIHVPRLGEATATPPPGAAAGAGDIGSGVAGPVDLNTASAEQLDSLPGVGPATAAAIIDHRTRNGPFTSVDELGDVSGIGPAKLAQLLPLVRV